MGPIYEVIDNISNVFDMQFQRKAWRKYLFDIKTKKILKKSLNRKLTCERSEFGKRGRESL